MNRLIRCVISFVLPFFCLLVSVSYAGWTEIPNTTQSQQDSSTAESIAGYTLSQIRGFFTADVSDRNTMLDAVKSAGYYVLWVPVKNDLSSYYTYVFPISSSVDFGGYTAGLDTSSFYFYTYIEEGYQYYLRNTASSSSGSKMTCTRSGYIVIGGSNGFTYPTFNTLIAQDPLKFGNLPYLKKLSSNSGYYWDGTSYYWERSEPEEPEETPTMPSNAEIAQAVQAFYNSDYYKNNKDFSDFMVLYNYDTKYFDFVGHNFGNAIGQVIVPPGYEYEGYSYNQDWWKFFLRSISSEIASNLWNRYYWLYSTNDFGENITYDGKGSIKDLIDIHFSTKSIIVYSTTDYRVVKIETDENGVLSPVEGTVPGDQYTYDENIDPTTNEYNPLENFVPSNPAQSILGDVDFDAINKTFEENKDILNIESASWLFAANNQLTNYFIGFLSLLIVFLIISRILGG